MKKFLQKTIAMLLIFCTTACTSVDTYNDKDLLNVVATTTMIYDLVGEIGGEKVEVTGLMGVGIDPHSYTASAGDVAKMDNADVVVYNGLHLEGQMGEVFETLESQNKNIICIGNVISEENLIYSDDASSTADPHIWFDVSLWKQAAEYVASSLAEIDAENSEYYLQNLEFYISELDNLEKYIEEKIAEIPEEQRILITAHDAFSYFGNAYGFEVIGIQGISTDLQASTADISELASFIAQNEIKSIFIESSVSSKNIEALQAAVLAKGFEVSIGGELYSDSLAEENNSYIATFKANIDTIVNSLK